MEKTRPINQTTSRNFLEAVYLSQVPTSSKTLQNLHDVNHHLDAIVHSLEILQLECNRDKNQYLLCAKIIEGIQTSSKILNSTDLTLPMQLALEVNRLFSIDKSLSFVCIKIENSKRIINNDAIAHLKLII